MRLLLAPMFAGSSSAATLVGVACGERSGNCDAGRTASGGIERERAQQSAADLCETVERYGLASTRRLDHGRRWNRWQGHHRWKLRRD
jgi:hypothetical protein